MRLTLSNIQGIMLHFRMKTPYYCYQIPSPTLFPCWILKIETYRYKNIIYIYIYISVNMYVNMYIYIYIYTYTFVCDSHPFPFCWGRRDID